MYDINENSWMRDPRYKHEYIDRFSKGPHESDKHLEARDRRYSCLKRACMRIAN